MNSKSNLDSVTNWIEQVKRGDAAGAHKIWNRFSERLIQIANRKLRSSRTRIVDGEDIAIIAFSNFLDRVEGGFATFESREDLWKILLTLTNRRAIDQLRKNKSLKNGGGNVVGESAFMDSGGGGGMSEVPVTEIDPDIQLMLTEEFESRLEALEDCLLREIALCRLSSMTYAVIGERLGISARSVERKCRIIRGIWLSDQTDDPNV